MQPAVAVLLHVDTVEIEVEYAVQPTVAVPLLVDIVAVAVAVLLFDDIVEAEIEYATKPAVAVLLFDNVAGAALQLALD